MKYITQVFICIANIAFSQSSTNNDKIIMNLKGKVKYTIEKTYIDSLFVTDLSITTKTVFNTLGDIIEIESSDSLLNKKIENKYDRKNNKIETHTQINNNKNTFVNFYLFNAKSKLLFVINNITKNETKSTIKENKYYLFDKKTNRYFITTDSFESASHYTYTGKEEYKYIIDTKGPNNKFINELHCYTDDYGNVTRLISFNEDNTEKTMDNKDFDVNGDLEKHDYSIVTVFDTYNPEYKDIYRKTYKYILDKNNNWISKTEYIDGKETTTYSREIKYY